MPAEVFDEERRAWIAARAGIWMFQKRRAELLGKRIRARSRAKVGTRPDPHDDQVSAPLVFRTSSTPTGALETGIVAAVAAAAPIGWPLGRMLYADYRAAHSRASAVLPHRCTGLGRSAQRSTAAPAL